MKPKSTFLLKSAGIFVCLILLVAGTSASSLAAPVSGLVWHDDFSSTTLNPRWSWMNEVPEHWSLTVRPGFMCITTEEGYGVSNILVQKAPLGDFVMETYMEFQPFENYQGAGLLIHLDDLNNLALIRAYCDWCGGNGLFFDHIEGGAFVPPNYPTFLTSQSTIWLRVVRIGNAYNAYFSENGTDWVFLGAHTLAFQPAVIGLTAHNSGYGPEQNADFDYFDLVDYTKYGYLPLVLN